MKWILHKNTGMLLAGETEDQMFMNFYEHPEVVLCLWAFYTSHGEEFERILKCHGALAETKIGKDNNPLDHFQYEHRVDADLPTYNVLVIFYSK